MVIKRISLLNYKNIVEVDLTFSNKLNCFFGLNGMGKTNLLDAIYYLSFCKSATNPIDSQNIRHGADFFMIQGWYDSLEKEVEELDEIYCGVKRRQKKQFKRNKKEYTKLSDHIGRIPLVMVTPADSVLILGGSDERRKFMDVVISQYDKKYLSALIQYNKAMAHRNALLKNDERIADDEFVIWEEIMAETGTFVHEGRVRFIEEFTPIFQEFYSLISTGQEKVRLTYSCQLFEDPLSTLLSQSRERDRIMGFSLKGIHKDDLVMELGGFPIKKEGSEGQTKTFLIALKLAQFAYLKRTGAKTPLLLLDDIFDKLDAERVEQIVKLVASDAFGQIFITDTNREYLDSILQKIGGDYKMFQVMNGQVEELSN